MVKCKNDQSQALEQKSSSQPYSDKKCNIWYITWMEKDSELRLVNTWDACTYIHTCMPASTHAPTIVINNCSTPSQWPKAVSESFSQAAITDLSILQGRKNLFSILHFVCSSDKELCRSTKVTKIKQLVSDRVRVRKKTDLVPSVHSTVPIWNVYHTHPLNPYSSLLCVLII